MVIAAITAWRELPAKGDESQKITKILQGSNGLFQDFVACLLKELSSNQGWPLSCHVQLLQEHSPANPTPEAKPGS
jgi:hypothetical protein